MKINKRGEVEVANADKIKLHNYGVFIAVINNYGVFMAIIKKHVPGLAVACDACNLANGKLLSAIEVERQKQLAKPNENA